MEFIQSYTLPMASLGLVGAIILIVILLVKVKSLKAKLEVKNNTILDIKTDRDIANNRRNNAESRVDKLDSILRAVKYMNLTDLSNLDKIVILAAMEKDNNDVLGRNMSDIISNMIIDIIDERHAGVHVKDEILSFFKASHKVNDIGVTFERLESYIKQNPVYNEKEFILSQLGAGKLSRASCVRH